jgi:hypothetical protein
MPGCGIRLDQIPPREATTLKEYNEFCDSCNDEFELDEDVAEEKLVNLQHFVISGRKRGENKSIEVTPLSDAPSVEQARSFRVVGDIDSAFGIMESLPLCVPCSYYPIPRWRDNLNRNIHIPYVHRTIDPHTGREQKVSHGIYYED